MKETIGFDIKASFARPPMPRLIKAGNIKKDFNKRPFSSTGAVMDWKLETSVIKLTLLTFWQKDHHGFLMGSDYNWPPLMQAIS